MNLNFLFMSEENQAPLIACIIPSQRWSIGGGGSDRRRRIRLNGNQVQSAQTGEVIREDGKLNAAKYRDILNENQVQSAQTGLKVHLPTWQSPSAHSQDNAGAAQGRLYERPRVELRTNQTSLKPVKGCPPMVPSQPDRAWDDLKRRMAKNKQMQMCNACCIIPKEDLRL